MPAARADRVLSGVTNEPSRAGIGGRRIGGLALVTVSLAVIAWATLRPGAEAAPPGLIDSNVSLLDFALNTALFLPLGAGMALAALPVGVAVVLGALGSGAVELAQHTWMGGRFASISDVVANTTGTLVGALVVTGWPSRSRWWRVVGPMLVVCLNLVWAFGALVSQAIRPSRQLVSLELHAPSQEPFLGNIQEVRFQGVQLNAGPVPDPVGFRARFPDSGTAALEFTAESGPATRDTARLLKIMSGPGTLPMVDVLQIGRTLRGYYRLSLSWTGLRVPWLILTDVLPASPGDTMKVRMEVTRKRLAMTLEQGAATRTTSLALSPDLFLSSLFNLATDGRLWWRHLPSFLFFLLFGLALARRPIASLLSGVFVLGVVPSVTGAAAPPLGVLAACAGGFLVGWTLARRVGLVPLAR